MVVAHSFYPQKLFFFHPETKFDKTSLVYTVPDAGLYICRGYGEGETSTQ